MARPSYKTGYARGGFRARYPSLWRGLVGAWCPALGETGAQLFDHGPYKYHGTLTNMDPATDWTVSDGRMALDFDGSNDQVVASGPQYQMADLIRASMCGWFFRTSTANIATFGFGTNGFYLFRMLQFTDSKIYCDIGNGVNSFPSITCALIGWVHFALIYDGSKTGVARNEMYVNGVQQTVTGIANNTTLASAANLGDFQIGRTTNGTRQTNGKLDDIRLYNRALTASEVATLARRRGIAYELGAPRRRKAPSASTSGITALVGYGGGLVGTRRGLVA